MGISKYENAAAVDAALDKGVEAFGRTASGIPYDNSASGLEADNVQSAIDEIKDEFYTEITHVNTSIAGKISAPEMAEGQIAKIGQVLAVKAVDEDGKPTEWEVVEKGGGGVKLPNLVDKVWLPCKPIPYQTGAYATLIFYKDELHVLGSSSSSYYTNHYKWNGNEWISVSTLPYKALRSSVVVYNDEIHLLGGSYDGNQKYYHYKWNGTKWTAASNLPIPFYDGNAVVHKGEIYLIGTSETDYSNNCFKWNGTTWSRIAYISGGANISSVAISCKNELYVFGAGGGDYKYIETSNTWSKLETSSGLGSYAMVVSDDKIHAIGGSSSSVREGRHYVYDSGKWITHSNTNFYANGKRNYAEYGSQIYYTTDAYGGGAVYVYTDIK